MEGFSKMDHSIDFCFNTILEVSTLWDGPINGILFRTEDDFNRVTRIVPADDNTKTKLLLGYYKDHKKIGTIANIPIYINPNFPSGKGLIY